MWERRLVPQLIRDAAALPTLFRQAQKRFATWANAIRQRQRSTVRFRNLPAQS
jgi:hypothetical protein